MAARSSASSRRQNRGEVRLGRRSLPELLQYGVQFVERQEFGRRDFDADGLAVCREIDDQTGLDPLGSNAFLISTARKVVLRRDRSAVPKGDVEVAVLHGCA